MSRWPAPISIPERQRPALLALVAGVVLIAMARLLASPGSAPLFDGVVSQEPYRYLNPTGSHAGNPTSFHATPAVEGGESPQFVAATAEAPPQAQLIAAPGTFALPAGTSALDVSIGPIQPPSASGGQVTGNVYRFSVTDPTGGVLAVDPANALTLVLRAPDGIVDATIVHLEAGSWQPLTTQPAGQSGIFIANVTVLGDFALILPATSGFFGLDPLIVGVAALAAGVSALVLLVLVWQRRRQPDVRRQPDIHRATTDNRPARPATDARRRHDRRRRGSRR